MKLTTTPFDLVNGELLPVYRDAYLHGDLANSSVQAVEAYLRRDASEAPAVVTRWHELQAVEEVAISPSWVGRQLQFVRERTQRFYQWVLSFSLIGLLLAGTSMANNHLPNSSLPAIKLPASTSISPPVVAEAAASFVIPSDAVEASKSRTLLVHGRILNEKGQPLAGAMLQKSTAIGASTDASDSYSLRVSASTTTTLQFGYGGYTEQETSPACVMAPTIILLPKPAERKSWLFF